MHTHIKRVADVLFGGGGGLKNGDDDLLRAARESPSALALLLHSIVCHVVGRQRQARRDFRAFIAWPGATSERRDDVRGLSSVQCVCARGSLSHFIRMNKSLSPNDEAAHTSLLAAPGGSIADLACVRAHKPPPLPPPPQYTLYSFINYTPGETIYVHASELNHLF